jgi:glucose-6-phosphate isomerase
MTLDDLLRWRCVLEDPFVELDLGHAGLDDAALRAREAPLRAALEAMQRLEAGTIANPGEKRQVGHYWLRAPGLAPDPETGEGIARTIAGLEQFALAARAGGLRRVVMLGIGGSALGPQLLADAFWRAGEPVAFHLIDNTDPDGIDRELERAGSLQDALFVVASKSGGTVETRNGVIELQAACARAGIEFAPRAVAVTMPGSALDRQAKAERWRERFPIWDWVGGRTSLWSAVGLLPAALLGSDARGLLAGAAAMDACTRRGDLRANPAAMLAAFWHAQGNGRGERAMVVLPYKDRLLLLSRYLQQLVMESLGKEKDRQGRVVHQGLTVYGNKGSTDQHAFVQQLRDGRHDFFAVFVRVLRARAHESPAVAPGVTSGDCLAGFWQGTRAALSAAGRRSATLTLEQLDERSLGALLALFERAVGLYAELIDVNAYDQPGVEAGKQAAAAVLELQQALLEALARAPRSCVELATLVGREPAEVWPVLRHLAANRADVRIHGAPDPASAGFSRAT